MKKYSFLLAAISSLVVAGNDSAQTTQIIDVVNNSEQSLQLNAQNADKTLKIDHNVAAYTKSCITVQMIKLKSLQDMLFDGIVEDSYEKIKLALKCGAMVNRPIDGKNPLLWAILLEKSNVAKILVESGASL